MASFIADKVVMEGLTYDDVLLVPAYSEVLPRTVSLTTKFSRNIELKIPFVTAAMDTVTEATMAIAIAREGGIGVIHKNMSIEDQARQVAMYLAKQHTKSPLTVIGSSIGGRNHATVLHSCKAVADMIDTDKQFKSQIEEIEKIVLGKN